MPGAGSYRRGATAGVWGATVLALWFLAIDVAQGTPLQTPAFLAHALAGVPPVPTTGVVAAYTLLHFAVFLLIGIASAWAVRALGLRPHFLLGLVLGLLLFNIMFYVGVVVTNGGAAGLPAWPAVLSGNLLAGMALLGHLQRTAPEPAAAWREALAHYDVLREGIIAGVLGAGVVAGWLLLVDSVQGRPLFTPAAIGSAVFLRAGSIEEVRVTAGIVAAYTLVHVGTFLSAGILAAAVLRAARAHPSIVLGGVLLFATLQALFIGFIAIAAAWLLGALAWWAIGSANVLAALVMGGYLWRTHPELRGLLARHDLEDPRVDDRDLAALDR
jgi:hypothetical protein